MAGLSEGAWIGINVLIVAAVLAIIRMTTRSRIARDEIGGQRESDYRELAARYDALASQSASAQVSLQTELTELRTKVESMERMLAEVG